MEQEEKVLLLIGRLVAVQIAPVRSNGKRSKLLQLFPTLNGGGLN